MLNIRDEFSEKAFSAKKASRVLPTFRFVQRRFLTEFHKLLKEHVSQSKSLFLHSSYWNNCCLHLGTWKKINKCSYHHPLTLGPDPPAPPTATFMLPDLADLGLGQPRKRRHCARRHHNESSFPVNPGTGSSCCVTWSLTKENTVKINL